MAEAPAASGACRYLFLLTEGLEATVIDSQVVDPVLALRRAGLDFSILSLVDLRQFRERRAFYARRRRAIAARTGGRVRVLPLVQKREAWGPSLAVPLLALELYRGGRGPRVVHARGEWALRIALGLTRWWPRLRVIYDVRGDHEAEFLRESEQLGMLPAQRERLRRRIVAAREAGVEGAAHVLCVSEPLRELLAKRHGLTRERCTVLPCAADESRFHPDPAERQACRRELGVAGRFVVVFPGRFGRWHYNEESFRVVRALLDAQPDAFFLILTPDSEAAARLGQRLLPAGRYAVRAAEHAEMPRYLQAADLGLLLREAHPINAVACPTKFAEYVLSGLPVLISAGIGDCSAFVAEHGAGVVLQDAEPAAAVHEVQALREGAEAGELLRERIATAGRARFSRDRYLRALVEMYRRVGEEA